MKYLSYAKKAISGGIVGAGGVLAAKADGGLTKEDLAAAAGAFVVGAILVFFTPKNGEKPTK